MAKLLSPPSAAKLMGVPVSRVKEWARRADDPLPSVPVGKSGKFIKILVAEIDPWLAREAERAREETRPQQPAARRRPAAR